MTAATLAAADAEPISAPLRVTAHAIPDPDPPYDAEPTAGWWPSAGAGDAAADGAVDEPGGGPDGGPGGGGPAGGPGDGGPGFADASGRRLPPCPPFLPSASSSLRLVPPLDADDDEGSFEPVRTPRGELEDPLPRAAMLARALLEAMAGTRPISQLTKWVTPEVLAVAQSAVVHRAARPVPTALRRVLVSEPLPGIAEVTAIVDRGPRAEAMALRLEGLDGRWRVTALQRA